MPETILIVDDEPKIVEVIRSYLENSGYRTLAAFDGKTALDLFAAGHPELVLLDLMLPDRSGEEVCREIRRQSAVPIIMLTARVDEDSILNGLAIGADDYITKPFSPRQVVARVQATLRRSRLNQPELPRILSFQPDLELDTAAHMVYRNNRLISLTPTEYKLLLTLAQAPGRTFTRDDLVRLAFGDDFDGYDRTVDSHIKNLRQKIEDQPRDPQLVQTVFGVGYRFGGEAK